MQPAALRNTQSEKIIRAAYTYSCDSHKTHFVYGMWPVQNVIIIPESPEGAIRA